MIHSPMHCPIHKIAHHDPPSPIITVMEYTHFSALLAFVSTSMATALTDITDSNFKAACGAWVSNPSTATTTYGDMKDW